MGGSQSTTQIQDIVQKRVMNVVSSTLMQKNTTVDQETTGSQVIRNITVGLLPPNYCPPGTAPEPENPPVRDGSPRSRLRLPQREDD